ncbi:hypothetical protein [Paenibacillus sp. FSL R10-2736]|uniref:hypothetical protein n=1 Tax=Paenibacillus sp. FSL R10-2736 TaxID=2954692 RepID=UPI0030FAE959
MSKKNIKSLKTIGGKVRILEPLIKIITHELRTSGIAGFMDLFGGGNKFIPQLNQYLTPERVYNELDLGIANLWECTKDYAAIMEVINLTCKIQGSINSQKTFNMANIKRRLPETSKLESAALTIIVAEYSRAGDRKTFFSSNADNGITRKSLEKYLPLVPIMREVTVANKSYEYYFENYTDRSDMMVLLDPPYVDSDIYLDGFTRKDHEVMVGNIITNTKMKVLLCGTDNDIYDKHLTAERGWYKYCLGDISKHSSPKKGEKQTEYIWTDFSIPYYLLPKQHSYL